MAEPTPPTNDNGRRPRLTFRQQVPFIMLATLLLQYKRQVLSFLPYSVKRSAGLPCGDLKSVPTPKRRRRKEPHPRGG